jgi:hypothetical protein
MEADKYRELNQKARDLVQLIQTRFVTTEGLLSRTYPPTRRTLFDNFDDIVPFFCFFGETPFLLSQIGKIRENGESMLSLCVEDGVLISRNMDEWLGGLYALWKETKDDVTYSLLKESMEFMVRNLFRNGFLPAALYMKSGKAAAYYESWSSGLLECFCEMKEDFPQAFKAAEKVLRSWVQDEYFREYSIFPYRVYSKGLNRSLQKGLLSRYFPIRRNSRPFRIRKGVVNLHRNILERILFYGTNGLYSQLMKSNSTCAFALLEFYTSTGDPFWFEALLKWIDGAIEHFYDNGRVYMEAVPRKGMIRDAGIASAFILGDVLCDTVNFSGDRLGGERDKLLKITRSIIDRSWETRLENGMIPYQEGDRFAHIDDQVDFAVTMRRFAELSGERRYRDMSIELTERVISLHYSEEGYVTFSGSIDRNVVDPKYNALLLKGFINLLTIDEPLYPKYHSLFKDR